MTCRLAQNKEEKHLHVALRLHTAFAISLKVVGRPQAFSQDQPDKKVPIVLVERRHFVVSCSPSIFLYIEEGYEHATRDDRPVWLSSRFFS